MSPDVLVAELNPVMEWLLLDYNLQDIFLRFYSPVYGDKQIKQIMVSTAANSYSLVVLNGEIKVCRFVVVRTIAMLSPLIYAYIYIYKLI